MVYLLAIVILYLLSVEVKCIQLDVTVDTAAQAASPETLVFDITLKNGTLYERTATLVADIVGRKYSVSVLSGVLVTVDDIEEILVKADPTVMRTTNGDAACFSDVIESTAGFSPFLFYCLPNPVNSYNHNGNDTYCVDYFHLPGPGIQSDVLRCGPIRPTYSPPTPAPPTAVPTAVPTAMPTDIPTTMVPTAIPTDMPTLVPTVVPSSVPTAIPTLIPTVAPTVLPTTPPLDSSSPVGTNSPTQLNESSVIPVTETPDVLRHLPESYVTGTVLAASLSVSSASSASSLLLFTSPCTDGEPELPRAFHLSQVSVAGSLPAGAVIVNGVVVIIFAGFFKILSLLMRRCSSSNPDPDASLRYPAIPLVGFRVLYQSLCFSSFLLLYYSDGVWLSILGGVTLLCCVAVPVLLTPLIANVVREAQYSIDPCERSRLYTVMLGEGEWVSRIKSNDVVLKYGSFFKGMVPKGVCFPIIELASALALAAISSFRADDVTQCGHIKVAQAIVTIFLIVVQVVTMPYHRGRDFVILFIVFASQATSLLVTAASHYRGNRSSLVGDMLLTSAVVALCVKVALDVICELYLLITGRRDTLQRRMWRRESKSFELIDNSVVDMSEDWYTHQITLYLPPDTHHDFKVV